MTQAAVVKPLFSLATSPRKIIQRTKGRRHGPIVRLMSPGDLGEVLKPFVFLDHFDTGAAAFSGMALHPHSGITTVTHLFEGSVRYEDTTGARGLLPAGGVEWFKAGHGAWHGGGPGESGRTRGFQLWLALPPDHELGPVESIYQSPDDIVRDGPASVLVGTHATASSRLKAPGSLTYVAVRLKAGEAWRYQPAPDHTAGWVALSKGRVRAPERIDTGEMAILEPSNGAIDFEAESDAEFVVGSAAPHPYDLALGYYSVHTGPATLEAGERRISEIGQRLKREGRL